MKLRLTLENATGLPATTTASVEFGDRDSLSIGRAQGLDWTLPDPSRLMSGKHCEIRRSAQAYLLYDLSTNGTFVDGSTTRLSSPHALRDGEGLLVGAYLIRVELSDDSDPAAHDDKTRLVPRSTGEPRLELTLANTPAPAGQHSPTTTLGREGVLRIGRDDSADWTLPDRSGGISRNHCTIRFADGAFVLDDTSANGTFVNDSGERIAGSYRLRDGDRLVIGPYLVAARISGLANAAPPAAAADAIDEPVPAASEAPRPPASPPRPGGARRGGDPAALLADLPPPALPPASRAAAEHGSERRPATDPAADDGVTRLARVLKTPPPAVPATDPAATLAASEPAAAATLPPPAAGDGAHGHAHAPASDPVLAAIARGLGLSDEDLEEADAAALGERLGQLILLVTDEVRQLLALRNAALDQPPGGRAQPGGSNPLAIMPTSEEALRVLFGPPRRAYLDSHQSFQSSLAELGQHLRQTDAAIRAASQVLASELAPEAIDKAAAAENRIGQLLSSRKARLWDLYVERWNSRPPVQPHRAVASFVETFTGETAGADKRQGK
ncbi:MAG: type VI secretion system-associated FHA domain protein TagH [Candidatus Accumulibacter phosphatis]|uniref:type VI secretion system-associated FHA domain protein TagH n=1 Tax=Candidatus Accumulibacter phosphatis TaxID=327160 RepID=UPI001A54D694|nr:type VI secretion system-associated FHA domain protein TagH [Candidatus Accumulibacter phosphatis]